MKSEPRDGSRPSKGCQYTLFGRRCQYDWESVLHLLGKRTDHEIAGMLGCADQAVRRMRKRLRIPKHKKVDAARPILGRLLDREVAARHGVDTHTVYRWRRAEGIRPTKVRGRRLRELRLKHARMVTEMEETPKHG